MKTVVHPWIISILLYPLYRLQPDEALYLYRDSVNGGQLWRPYVEQSVSDEFSRLNKIGQELAINTVAWAITSPSSHEKVLAACDDLPIHEERFKELLETISQTLFKVSGQSPNIDSIFVLDTSPMPTGVRVRND